MEEKSYESKQLPAPTWLSGAVVRPQQASSSTSSFVNDAAQQHQQQQQQQQQQAEAARKWCGCEPGSQCVRCSFLHLPSTAAASTAPAGGPPAGRPPSSLSVPPSQQASGNSTNPWLSSPAMAMASAKLQAAVSASDLAAGSDVAGSESLMALSTHHHHQQDVNHGHSPNLQQGRAGQLLDLHSDTANSSDLVDGDGAGGGAGGGGGGGDQQHHHQDSQAIWQNARLKADISMHPLYDQLLAAHVACLRVATPVDQLPRIDAQISQASQVLTKYSVLGQNHLLVGEEKEELDQFMTHYVLLLCTFKEQLQQHVRIHAMDAVMACWELEQSLLSLTGVSPGEGTGATMSDDDDDPGDSDPSIYDTGFDAHDSGAFGPLIPTETERSLMERVRQELKNELKSGYKDRIVDVREEILRKRRAGKLPGDTTSVLKAWWQAHSKWPYPTEDEKARLQQETGLQLKQINNWFINQRKRNWHSNPSSTAALKNKRKR